MAAAFSIAVVLPAVDVYRRHNSDIQRSKRQHIILKSQIWGDTIRDKSSSSSSALSSNYSSRSDHSSYLIVSRLFTSATFEASKLKVILLLSHNKQSICPEELLPRAYTVTHCDITSKITLAISETINKSQIQGWYNRLQRDEVLAEWKRCQGSMSLHLHCHISGGHWLLDPIAQLRFYIFRKELPVVLQALIHGDQNLFTNHPELQEAMVWVYFHSNVEQFNLVECWGSLKEAANSTKIVDRKPTYNLKRPMACPQICDCCAPYSSVIPMPPSFQGHWHRPNVTMSNEEPQNDHPHVLFTCMTK